MTLTNRSRTPSIIAAGTIGGFALGVAARAWMRLITTEPEFTWNGTMFIVLGFALWGTGQGIATATRARTERRWKVAAARTIGAVTTLPLFMAAGGIMAPTVVAGSLARHRTDWSGWARAALGLVALLPVWFVGSQLHDDFGFGWRWLAGMVGLFAIYALVVMAERGTAQLHGPGGRVYTVLRVVAASAAALLIVVASRGIV